MLPLKKFGTLLETQEPSQSRLDSRLFMETLVSTSESEVTAQHSEFV